MTACNQLHPVNALCQDRKCYLGERNPYLRLLRRLERAQSDLRRLRDHVAKKLSRSGVRA